MNSFEIVTLTPDQWAAYKDIRMESLMNEPQAFFSTYVESAKKPDSFWQERLAEAQDGNESWLYFAKDGEKIIGIIGAYVKDNKEVAEIVSVYVNGDARGQGVSKMLMNKILQVLSEKDSIKTVRLAVNVDQTPALNLYKSYGFQITEKKNILMGDGKYHDEYIMLKQLR